MSALHLFRHMNIRKHFCTITKHRWLVMKACFKMGLYWQGLVHDLSKYSPSEFIPGAKYYVGYRSPNDMQRKNEGYSSAWLHHKGRNMHHFEYWYDYRLDENEKIVISPVRMPVKYVAEMVADRLAASKVYQGKDYTDASAFEYYEKGRRRGSLMHEDTEELLGNILLMIKECGEKEALAFVKSKVLKCGYDTGFDHNINDYYSKKVNISEAGL